MNGRERLIEILENNATCIELGIEGCDTCQYGRVEDCYSHALVDHLIANDVVPVVRCKDCKHFWESFSGTHYCKLHKGLVGTKYDTYCSYGEREDNG